MPCINKILLSCTDVFEPISCYIHVYAKCDFKEPAQRSVDLFRLLAHERGFIVGESTFRGFTQGSKIILAQETKADMATIWHERFHVKVTNQIKSDGFDDRIASTVIEESFAEAYSILRTKTKDEQQFLISKAENARSEFNKKILDKEQKGLVAVISKIFERKQNIPYPLILFNLQYKAYTDLAIKMFWHHKVPKTVYHTAIACQKAYTTGDHRIGISYLNNTLPENERITNLLAIKSLYTPMESYLSIDSCSLSYDLFGAASSGLCAKLAQEAFELFCPAMLQSEIESIYPAEFLQKYNMRRKLNK